MVAASRPQTAAARAGVHSATWAASSSNPTVWSATHSWSTRPSRISTCIIASISAMSVPGSGWMNWSAASAVIVRTGSMTTTRAPSARAASMVGQRWRLVSRVFVAHRMIRREWRSSRASSVRPVPLVIVIPAPTVGPHSAAHQPAGAHVVEEAAVETHHRQQALVAGVAERQHRLGAVGVDHVAEAGADLGEGVVPADRFEAALALGSGAAQRVQHPVGAVHAVEEAVDLGAQLALAERVVGVAADLDGDAVFDGDLPPARVRAVVVARAVHDVHRHHATPPRSPRRARVPQDSGT